MTVTATDTTAVPRTRPLPVPGATRPADPAGVVLLTVSEMAVQTGVSARSVYRLIHAGELPALRIGHSFRILAPAAPDRHPPAGHGPDTNLTSPKGEVSR